MEEKTGVRALAGAGARGSRGDSFFFSSRRRHTRSNCDWSSDVCSSDLPFAVSAAAISQHLKVLKDADLVSERRDGRQRLYQLHAKPLRAVVSWVEIGRASCRERV